MESWRMKMLTIFGQLSIVNVAKNTDTQFQDQHMKNPPAYVNFLHSIQPVTID